MIQIGKDVYYSDFEHFNYIWMYVWFLIGIIPAVLIEYWFKMRVKERNKKKNPSIIYSGREQE
jgi:putative flippase GtrA